jgi:hypothetical protein
MSAGETPVCPCVINLRGLIAVAQFSYTQRGARARTHLSLYYPHHPSIHPSNPHTCTDIHRAQCMRSAALGDARCIRTQGERPRTKHRMRHYGTCIPQGESFSFPSSTPCRVRSARGTARRIKREGIAPRARDQHMDGKAVRMRARFKAFLHLPSAAMTPLQVCL